MTAKTDCSQSPPPPRSSLSPQGQSQQSKARIAGATGQVDTFKMMTTGKQLPSEHFADYSFVFN